MKKELIVITGASSGIGAATAKYFAAEGYPLLLIARRIERLIEMNLPNTLCKKVDVTNGIELKNAISEAEVKFGYTGCLINNAGTMFLGAAYEQDPSEWEKMIDVNIKGVLQGIHAVLPDMVKRQNGTIINLGSISSHKTFINHSVYCGTKFAISAITETIRQEVAPHNVRMIMISPGAVETEILNHTTSELIKKNYQDWKQKTGGGLSPDIIAQSILFAYQQPQTVCVREIILASTRHQG